MNFPMILYGRIFFIYCFCDTTLSLTVHHDDVQLCDMLSVVLARAWNKLIC